MLSHEVARLSSDEALISPEWYRLSHNGSMLSNDGSVIS